METLNGFAMRSASKLPPAIKKRLRSIFRFTGSVAHLPRQIWWHTRLRSPEEPLSLHLGCGQKRSLGFVNIDINWSPAVDYICDAVKLPCPDGKVSRIETYHVIEHLRLPQVEQALSEWHRVLEPGGVLIIECPDLRRSMEEVLAGNQERMYSIYGRHRYPGDIHYWGYTVETLSELLRKFGFDVVSTPPAKYHGRGPSICVEAKKRASANTQRHVGHVAASNSEPGTRMRAPY